MTNDHPQLITTVEAAAILQVSIRTVTRWAESGTLPEAIKGAGIRGPRFFGRDDVERLAEQLAAKGAESIESREGTAS